MWCRYYLGYYSYNGLGIFGDLYVLLSRQRFVYSSSKMPLEAQSTPFRISICNAPFLTPNAESTSFFNGNGSYGQNQGLLIPLPQLPCRIVDAAHTR